MFKHHGYQSYCEAQEGRGALSVLEMREIGQKRLITPWIIEWVAIASEILITRYREIPLSSSLLSDTLKERLPVIARLDSKAVRDSRCP